MCWYKSSFTESGIIVFNVISGTLAKKARLEVLLDDGYWPCFTTIKARSTDARWEYVGEGFIKEIDFSRVWLRLNEAEEGNKDDIIAEWKGDAKPFLQSALVGHPIQDKEGITLLIFLSQAGPHTVTLHDQDERHTSTVTLEARYVPVPVKLEPRETINSRWKTCFNLHLFDLHRPRHTPD